MDKFEFSDLYKFLVSAGIVLVGLAILLPWFYLKEPFDLLIEKNKIVLLTIEAQNIIKGRQALIGNLYYIIPYTSVFLLICGIASVVFGLCKWFKKQADIDKRDLLTTKKLENEVKEMTTSEVAIKNEKEFEEAANIPSDNEQIITTTTTTKAPTKDHFISSYLQIEQFFSNRLTSIYQDKYKILANISITDTELRLKAEYDLILSSLIISDSDYIFEFKYYPIGVTKATLRNNMFQLDWRSKVYSDKVKSNVKPILLIILPPERYNEERFIELRKIPNELNLINKNIKVDFINSQILDDLGDDYFKELINT